ncbi:MAG: type I glutamate--ammonia ligase [Clostridia bacterium]|nr:type I glutamate--ammonia ligase [Clostridia bacterium]
MFKNYQELQRYCVDNNIQMIDFKMIDLEGRWRHLTIPAERFTEQTLISGIGFDGSNYGFAPTEKSDMVFIPDVSSAFEDPFCSVKTICMIGDIFVIGNPHRRFEQDPRTIADASENFLKESGIADEIRIGPEFEFIVLDQMSYRLEPNQIGFELDAEQAKWNSGRADSLGFKVPHKGGYHIDAPFDILYNLRSEICMMLEERGVKVKYHHHEVAGPGQLEIEVEFGNLREMADKSMLIKYIIRNAAFQAGKSATFMPKPILGEAGNGLHVHMHLFKNGQPVFFDEKGYSGLSQTALYFIGGILRHAKSISAFANPSTNSYKRLVPGYEAPVNICFATANRSSVIRIPAYAKLPKDKRFEYRAGDGTANPYLAYAAMLMAGIDGVKNKIDPVKEGYGPYDMNLYNLSDEEKKKIKSLPRNLDEALDALEADNEYLQAGGVFPQRLIEIWIKQKRKQAAEVNTMPHPAEFALYYDL